MTLALLLTVCTAVMAQRFTDNLDRGLVAIPTDASSPSNLVSWRRLADEYYNTTYNLYRGSTKIESNLTVTTYYDANGNASSQYSVAAVVNGTEQTKCAAVTRWNAYVYKLNNNRYCSGYIDIDLAAVYDRNGTDVTSNYQPNDAEMADLDGDGQLEIIIKRLNTADASTGIDASRIYSPNSTQFVVLDAYDVNWQTGAATLMWRIDCGPNMVSMNSTEIDIIAYDWDEDGKAEVVLRGADNMIVYGTDGKTSLYTIGDMTVNTRDQFNTTNAQYAWTHTGAEYLIYMNGKTGALYQKTDFPLKRLESGETKLKSAWGDDYGHRSSKYFFGAPFLDGRTANLFMARGIYTRHKMIAMNLDKASHQWSERWRWNNNSKSSSWYGQGNHNFVIADVDEDGRDEIVYGSMVIDDNGCGLSTTGLGHGDAMHVSDFDPYRKGLEVFACNEDKPKNNYRNGTTSEIYYRVTGSDDDGRALMGNFTNDYPGAVGRSVGSGMVNALRSNTIIDALSGDTFIPWGELNFRIYWDGDLCSEILNSPGTAKEAKIEKPGIGRLFTSSGCNMNNDSKNNPCFQGDIIGDWREEIVVRRGTGLRVYSTGLNTTYSMPCLWFDHQYRQAMVWQMMAYNQPPHVSYYLGEMEDITIAPPPLTTRGRTEISSGSSITSTHNGKHVLICDAASVGIATSGVSPKVVTVNASSVVSGHDNNSNISYSYNSVQLGANSDKGDITGDARLVKQGDGLLKLTNRTFSYTGSTDVWGGSLFFLGTLSGSDVWMNRHTSFFSGATITKSLTMEYGATLYPTGGNVTDAETASYGTTTIGTLNLHEGARIVLQADPKNAQYDKVNIGTLAVRKRSSDAWENYGPEYLKPVIEIRAQSALTSNYVIGTIGSLAEGTTLNDIIIEGVGENASLMIEAGNLVLDLGGEIVTKPTITGDGKIKTVTPGVSSIGNNVSVYYTTAESTSPETDGTKVEKGYVKMPNQTTYYFYSVSDAGVHSAPVAVTFDGIVTETYPFQQWAGEDYGTINYSSEVAFKDGNTDYYYATSVSKGDDTHSLNKRFGLRSEVKNNSNIYFWMRKHNYASNTGLFCNNSADRKMGIMHLNPGDKFTITMSNTFLPYLRTSNIYLESDGSKTKIAEGTALTNGATYVVADDAGEDCYVLLGTNGASYFCVATITLQMSAMEESISAPTIKIAGAYEGTRTISITPGTGSQGSAATATYYTLDGSEPSETNGTLYAEPFEISETTTVKAVSYLIDDMGEVAEKTVTAGEPLTLNAPQFTSTAYQDGAYTITIHSDQSSLDAAPAEVGYYYSIDGGETMRAVDGGQVKVYGGSTLTAYSSADGYVESEETSTTMSVMPFFDDEGWIIDFTAISSVSYSSDKLGDYTLLKNDDENTVINNFGVPGSGGNNDKAFIHSGGLYMMFGGNRSVAVNANEGQYVRLVVKGTVNSASAGLTRRNDLSYGNCHIYQVNTSGISTINLARNSVIYTVEVLNAIDNPTVTKTISAAGWATYCSPYALDFSSPIENLTKAYYVTGVKANSTVLTLLEINGPVPAGTGVLLQGEGECQIPILSGSGASTEGNLLVGVLEATQLEANTIYVLLKENNKVGFFRNNNAFTVSAQTAYLPAEAIENLMAVPTEARSYQFLDDSEINGVQEVRSRNNDGRNSIYNLQGQRVSTLRRGVYIINGKKYVKK